MTPKRKQALFGLSFYSALVWPNKDDEVIICSENSLPEAEMFFAYGRQMLVSYDTVLRLGERKPYFWVKLSGARWFIRVDRAFKPSLWALLALTNGHDPCDSTAMSGVCHKVVGEITNAWRETPKSAMLRALRSIREVRARTLA